MNNIIKFSELENNPEEVERIFSLDNEKMKLRKIFYNVPEELKNEKIIILKNLVSPAIKESLIRKALVKYKEEDLEIDFCLKVGETFNSSGSIKVYEIIYLPYKSSYGDFQYTFIDLVKYAFFSISIHLEKYLPVGIYSGIPYDLEEDTDNSNYILINKVRAKDLESIVKNQVTELISNMDVINKNFSVIGIKIIK